MAKNKEYFVHECQCCGEYDVSLWSLYSFACEKSPTQTHKPERIELLTKEHDKCPVLARAEASFHHENQLLRHNLDEARTYVASVRGNLKEFDKEVFGTPVNGGGRYPQQTRAEGS